MLETDFIEIFSSNNIECEKIINWFNNNKNNQKKGIIYKDSKQTVDLNTKDSTDISLSLSKLKNDEELSSLFYPLFLNLNNAFNQYIQKYNILEDIRIEIHDTFNVQHYKKNQHFKQFHFESSGFKHRKRILTWMIYLNNVENGGNTVFPYYNYTIQPIEGYILIWPAEFTHTHFGDIVADEKYIVTGWFDVVNTDIFSTENLKVAETNLLYFNV
jgi:hypothetical protein